LVAVLNGINGVLVAAGVGIISGLGGYEVGRKTKKDPD